MNKMLSADEESSFAVAYAMEAVAEAMKLRRHQAYAAGKLTPVQYEQAVANEIALRGEAARVALAVLGSVLNDARLAQRDVEQAIREAEIRIKTIKSVKNAFQIAATLITLAGALYSGNGKAIAAAFKEFLAAVKDTSESATARAAAGSKRKTASSVAKKRTKNA